MSTGMEKVNHPQYYNRHPSGVECIDIIRNYVCDIANALKYLWRAGLKGEEGLTPVAKEVEDLQKAVWYIHDFIDNYMNNAYVHSNEPHVVRLADGRVIQVQDIARHYDDNIAVAITMLWSNGVIADGVVVVNSVWLGDMQTAVKAINARIRQLQATYEEIPE